MKSKAKSASLIGILVLLAGVLLVFNQQQAIYDWIKLRGYTPPAAVVNLADATTMNNQARHMFYVNRPVLQNKEEFNLSCSDNEQSIVLGCYIRNKGIYLYNVNDQRLAGVEEVTAAHEMLHVAYDRLSQAERDHVNQLINVEAMKITNQRILKTIESYKRRDPNVVNNELHSIIGTEVRTISSELESYYKKYFNNRSKVVELSERYENAFTSLEDLSNSYLATMKNLKAEIEKSNQELSYEADDLAAEYKTIEAERNSADAQSFNNRVYVYNSKVNAYNVKVNGVSTKIDEYNRILVEYNNTISKEGDLYNAIDSRPKTINNN